MTSAHPRLPNETPHDLLHALALSVGTPMACIGWPDARCIWANAAYAQLFDISTQDLIGHSPTHYLPACDWQHWKYELERLARTGTQGASLQIPLIYGRQQSIPTLLLAQAPAGQVNAIIVVPQHSLSLLVALQLVQDGETRLQRYAHATSEAIIFFRQLHIVDANPAATALTGYPLSQLLNKPVLRLLPHVLHADAAQALEHGTSSPYETRLLRHSGQEVDVEINVSLLPEGDTHTGLLVMRDISERKRAEAEMHFLAFHDPLTRLPNRQGLMRQLHQAIERAKQSQSPAAVLYVDLDRFKDVNDSLGHEAGDKILIEVARRLRSKVHPDDIVARLSSDEFVLVLASTATAGQPECIAHELRFVLNKPYLLPSGQVHQPASIGISLYPEDGDSADALILNASAAMETAKKIGLGALQYYNALMEMRPSRLLAQDRLLREAIANDQGLVLLYQPQWNLQTNQLAGFEALVYWQHPERGLLPPNEFIAFAESRGLIALVDRWVMRKACKQLRAWRNAGLRPVPVAVNMSASEFNQSQLLAEVEQILKDTDVEPQWLEIELTETVLMKQSAHVIDTLHALQQIGVRLSIDDFGTGYSSLAYLKRYPLDKLKIDRTFVQDISQDQADLSMVTAIIHMARSLHLRTVAEGVETPEQWELLQRLGCDMAQGYYLARPMTAKDATLWQMQSTPLTPKGTASPG